jgi:hypothetical protein
MEKEFICLLSAVADRANNPQGNISLALRMEKPKLHLSSSLMPFNQLPDQ